jgi:hypothetical protein
VYKYFGLRKWVERENGGHRIQEPEIQYFDGISPTLIARTIYFRAEVRKQEERSLEKQGYLRAQSMDKAI